MAVARAAPRRARCRDSSPNPAPTTPTEHPKSQRIPLPLWNRPRRVFLRGVGWGRLTGDRGGQQDPLLPVGGERRCWLRRPCAGGLAGRSSHRSRGGGAGVCVWGGGGGGLRPVGFEMQSRRCVGLYKASDRDSTA